MRRLRHIFSTLFMCASLTMTAAAQEGQEQVFQQTKSFITEAFESVPEKPDVLWVTGELKTAVRKILTAPPYPLRYRYWRKGNRTAWILEDVGKVLPITTGIIIEDDKLVDIRVLVYRESHGSEIRYTSFTKQFTHAQLTKENKLSKPINGISGASLSTNSMKRMSRLALLLHRKVMENNEP